MSEDRKEATELMIAALKVVGARLSRPKLRGRGGQTHTGKRAPQTCDVKDEMPRRLRGCVG